MAGLTDRVIHEIGDLTIGGTNYSAQIKNVDLAVEIMTAENEAIRDSSTDEEEVRRRRTLTWSIAAEDDDGMDIMAALLGIGASVYTFSYRPYKVGSRNISGNLQMKGATNSTDANGVQVRNYSGTVKGTPTVNA